MSKRSNTLSLIHLEEYETPLVFQKLQNVGHDLSFCVLNPLALVSTLPGLLTITHVIMEI